MDGDNLRDLKLIRKYIAETEKDYAYFKRTAQEGFDYYDNKDKIKRTGAAAIDEVNAYLKLIGANPLHSADNRIPMNRHRIVIDQKIGYMFTVPPAFDISSDDHGTKNTDLLKKVNDIIGTQWAKVIKQLGLDASNTSRAWLAYWYDESGKFDYWFVNPLTVRPVYDCSTIKKKLQYLIRAYDFIDEKGNPAIRFEVWDDKEVAYLIKSETSKDNKATQIDFEVKDGEYNIQPHRYGRIPFIEFRNNAHGTNDLIMYKDIIDALDKLVSGFANDVDDIQEIIWLIKNYSGDKYAPIYKSDGSIATDKDGNALQRPVDRKQMIKAQKILDVGADGDAKPIQAEIPYEARKTFRDILNDEFWVSAMAVNPNPDKIGNQSGIFIDYLFGQLEEKAGLMETEFRSSIDEFLKAILHYLDADESEKFIQTWKRTKPQNNVEIADIISKTPDTVMSEETKTRVHPLIKDTDSERKKIEKEQKRHEQNTLDLLEQPPPKNKDGGS